MVYCELSPTAAARREKLTCKVCGRTFNRQEHLQRHARTHTKEKPYSCSCGHSFSRKDLLTRHERLAHASGRNSEEQSAASASPVTERRGQSPRLGMDDHFAITASRDQSVSLSSIPQDLSPSAFLPPSDPDFIAHTGEPQMIDPFLLSSTDGLFAGCDDPISGFTRFLSHGDLNIDWNESLMDPTPTLRDFNSTEHQIFQQITPDSVDFSSRVPDDPAGDDDFRELKPLSCPWLVSEAQYLELNDALTPFRNVISHFVLPSRMAVARYTLGYVEGFSDHYPFLHIPTLQLTRYTQTPELVLAILAIGAQYRYETRTARSLYQASRSIVLERLQRGDLFPSTDPPARVQPYKTHMDRTRALLLLATYCSWHSHTGQMQEFSDYQSLIARSLRQIGLSEVTRQDRVRWTEWIDYETDRRTKFFGWILLSLQSLICNNPPLLLTRELNLRLPSSCQEWVARTEADWLTAASRYPSPVMFKEAHAAHLAAPSDEHPMSGLSPFANYILIHAVIQRIYMTHQISLDIHGQSLSARDAEDLEHALNRWRSTWCHSPESVLDLHNSYGSLSFTSTALLGVAHIRLHCNLGQWRDLQSGDPATVAATLQEAPLPHRGPHLIYALLHSVHSLNIPVQVGISYLSRCKSFSWSVDHAICDLECAAFLSKWLQGVADSHEKHPLSGTYPHPSASDTPSPKPCLLALETRVLRWIMRVVREALMSQDETMHLSHEINDYELRTVPWTAKLLSYAVVKVWAQMFKVCNSPWPMVGFIGQSLDHYAGLLHGSLADGGRHEGSGS